MIKDAEAEFAVILTVRELNGIVAMLPDPKEHPTDMFELELPIAGSKTGETVRITLERIGVLREDNSETMVWVWNDIAMTAEML